MWKKKSLNIKKLEELDNAIDHLKFFIDSLNKVEGIERFDKIIQKSEDLAELEKSVENSLLCYQISNDDLNILTEQFDSINKVINKNIDPLTKNLVLSADKIANIDYD